MTKIDIISGFLGAGKTTLIKKLLEEVYQGEKLVLIENEFGEIGIDGGFLKETGIQINELNSGCICCSLVGDFGQALKDVIGQYAPDRVIIEPSGVGKLSDVIAAVRHAGEETPMELGCFVTVVNAKRCKTFMKNFGEFFNNQVESAGAIILSRTTDMSGEKLDEVVSMLRKHNAAAPIITTPWEELTGEQIRTVMHGGNSLAEELLEDHHDHDGCCDHEHHHDHDECCDHEHHHDHDECCDHEHHHDHDECCDHEHHHDHDECCDHEHHHDHDECCDHEHHHDHDECCDHEHHHDHDACCGHDHEHQHHHADEVFTSWGTETIKKFTESDIQAALEELDTGCYGQVIRAKGILPAADGGWIHFDYTPGEENLRRGGADYTGRLCVIGAHLKEGALKGVFGL